MEDKHAMYRPIRSTRADTQLHQSLTPAKRARLHRFYLLKQKRRKRAKPSKMTSTTPSTSRFPLSDITQLNSNQKLINQIVEDGQRIEAFLQQTQPTTTLHSIHTPPKMFNLHNMKANLFSRFSNVATHQDSENQEPCVHLPNITNWPSPNTSTAGLNDINQQHHVPLLPVKRGRGRPKKVLGVPDRAFNLSHHDQSYTIPPHNGASHEPTILPRGGNSTCHDNSNAACPSNTLLPNSPNIARSVATKILRPRINSTQQQDRTSPACPVFTPAENTDFESDSSNDSDYDPFLEAHESDGESSLENDDNSAPCSTTNDENSINQGIVWL